MTFISDFTPLGAARPRLQTAPNPTRLVLRPGRTFYALRVTSQAMIANTVRNILRLIALNKPRHSSFQFGFSEDEPLRFETRTGARGISAGKNQQLCGNNTALAFDVAGLVTWLKRTFPRATTHHVEAKTGIPAASVENWLHRRSQPSVQHFSILLSVFGPSFLAACYSRPPQWVDEAAKNQRRREIEAQIARLENEREQFNEVSW